MVEVGEHEALSEYNAHAYATVVAERARAGGYGAVVFPATTLGKDLAPRVAALLDVPLAGDVTGLEAAGGTLTAVRPVYSGKAFAHLRLNASPALVTIRPNVFQPAESPAAGAVETFTPVLDPGSWKVKLVERKAAGDGAVDVAEATTVVSGGQKTFSSNKGSSVRVRRSCVRCPMIVTASRPS